MQEMKLLDIDRIMLDAQQVGDETGGQWRRLLELPRYRFLADIGDYAGLLLLNRPEPARSLTPEEKLLRMMFGGSSILAVRHSDRRLLALAPVKPEHGEWPGEDASAHEVAAYLATLVASDASGILDASAHPFSATSGTFSEELMLLLLQSAPPGVDARKTYAQLVRRERDMLRSACRQIIDLLVPETMRDMRRHRLPRRIEVYNWLIAAGEPVTFKRRLQAAEAYPLFAPDMASRIELGQIVDAGKQLVPALAEHHCIPVSIVRRLQRPLCHPLYEHSTFELKLVFAGLAALAPERVPATTRDWKAFLALNEELKSLRYSAGLGSRNIMLAGLHASRRYLRRVSRRGWDQALRKHKAMLRGTTSLLHLKDVFENMARLATGDAFFMTEDCTEAERQTLESVFLDLIALGVNKLAEISETWHAALREPAALRLPGDPATHWPALIRPFTASKRTVVALTDSEQLKTEGLIMEHCAGGYATHCYLQPVHILSIRDQHGKPRSTIEIRIETGPAGPVPRIAQHRARRNRYPGPLCRLAAKALLEKLSQDPATLGADWTSLEAARQARVSCTAHHPKQGGGAISQQERYALSRALPPETFAQLLAIETRHVSSAGASVQH